MTSWTASGWTRRWEALGGGWAMAGSKLAFLLPDQQDTMPALLGEIVGHPERLAGVRAYVIGRP